MVYLKMEYLIRQKTFPQTREGFFLLKSEFQKQNTKMANLISLVVVVVVVLVVILPLE